MDTSAQEPIAEILVAPPAGPVRAAGGWLFAMLGGASGIGYAAALLLVRSDYTTADFLRFFAIFFLLSCVWGLALWLAHRVEPARGTVLAGAVLFRLLLLPAGVWGGAAQYPGRMLYDGQLWMRLGDAVSWQALLGAKAAIVAFDIATLWLLMRIVGPGARGTLVLLAYAWNPLVVKEFAGSGHVDAIPVFFLAAACRPGTRPLTRAALLLAPGAALLRAWPGWGSSTFPPPLGRLLPGGAVQLAAGVAIALVLMLWTLRRNPSLHRCAVGTIGALLLVTPLYAPWRLTWLLPFAALGRSWFWLAMSGSIFLAYHAYLSFHEIPALSVLEFVMPLLIWLWLEWHSPREPQGL